MEKRNIGDISVSPMGMGCWAIGGEFWEGDKPLGWGKVDDKESIRAVHAGLDYGINFIDTANIYGAGHSEYVLAKALKGKRDQVVLSSKFGFDADESTKQVTGLFSSPDEIRSMCNHSLRRLATDYLDLYFFHINDFDPEKVEPVRQTLDSLVQEGKIRAYGWSTDYPDRAEKFVGSENSVAMQFELNVLSDNPGMIEVCEKNRWAAINRGPLAMGLLSGKYTDGASMSDSDIRKISPDWMTYFDNGAPTQDFVRKMEAIREILTSGGRTLTQGALAWLWARSGNNIPIPGFRTVDQIVNNAEAMQFGELSSVQLIEIDELIDGRVKS